MTDVLALDIASTTGWARGVVGQMTPACGSIRFALAGASKLATCGRALEWAIATLKPPLPDVVAIEGLLPPAVTRGRSNVHHDLLAMLHGVIMGVCFLRGVYKVRHHAVQSVRAHFLDGIPYGKGEGKLYTVRKCKSLGWLMDTDEDAADALALWSYQCALINPQHAVEISPMFQRSKAHGNRASDL